MMRHRALGSRVAAVAAAATTLVIIGVASGATGGFVLPVVDSVGTAKFSSEGGATPQRTTRTIPYWGFQATDPTNHTTYPVTMVGRDPAARTSTTVPTLIVPIKLVFSAAGGYALDGASRVAATVSSPIFSEYGSYPAMTGGDVGQYGDVFMRAQFNAAGSGYHVKLGAPTVSPTVTINVPKNHGSVVQTRLGAVTGLADMAWFSSQLQSLMGQMHISSGTLPIFLSDNTVLYIGSTDNCCVIGYHGAGKIPGNGLGAVNSNGQSDINTYIYSAYTTPGTFGDSGVQDIHALGHEVAEWLDDPFIDNAVNPWVTPTAPQYGCTTVLETGDPVVGIWYPLLGNPDPNPLAQGYWHPEDEVFWQWFLRQSPSSAFGGNYTLMGPYNPYPGFRQPATGCN